MTVRCQQRELYQAEALVASAGKTLTITEAQALVDSLAQQEWWPDGVTYVDVVPRDGRTNESVGAWDETTGRGVIEMLPVHLVENFICHELAHVLAAAQYNSRAHDPAFCRHYLRLVYEVRGTEAWQDLRERLLEGGIEIG